MHGTQLPKEVRKGAAEPVAALPPRVVQPLQRDLEEPQGRRPVKEEVCRDGNLVVLGPAGKRVELPGRPLGERTKRGKEKGTRRARAHLRGGAQVHEAILRVQGRDGQLGGQGLGGRRVEDLVDIRGQRGRGRHVCVDFSCPGWVMVRNGNRSLAGDFVPQLPSPCCCAADVTYYVLALSVKAKGQGAPGLLGDTASSWKRKFIH